MEWFWFQSLLRCDRPAVCATVSEGPGEPASKATRGCELASVAHHMTLRSHKSFIIWPWTWPTITSAICYGSRPNLSQCMRELQKGASWGWLGCIWQAACHSTAWRHYARELLRSLLNRQISWLRFWCVYTLKNLVHTQTVFYWKLGC